MTISDILDDIFFRIYSNVLSLVQRKIKVPSPVPQDEDSRLSDRLGTELIDSDSDLDLPAVPKTKRPLESLPSVSSSTSSTAASSSDDTSSSDSSSESTDEEVSSKLSFKLILSINNTFIK